MTEKNEEFYRSLALERHPQQVGTFEQFLESLVRGGADRDSAARTAYRNLRKPPGGYSGGTDKMNRGGLYRPEENNG